MYRAYAFDLDGTLYRGDEAIASAVPVVAEIRRRGARILFLTNNSGQSSEEFAAKLRSLGYDADASEVYGTSRGAAGYLRSRGYRRPYVVGELGLARVFGAAGLEVVNLDAEGYPAPEPRAEADVVVTSICRRFSYTFMARAMDLIRRGLPFVATNRDATYPTEGGGEVPGAGSIVASLVTCGGVEPITIGKPNPYLLELAMADFDLKPQDVLVVGDRLDTDIACGRNAGCDTHLVLTGVTREVPEGQAWSYDLGALVSP